MSDLNPPPQTAAEQVVQFRVLIVEDHKEYAQTLCLMLASRIPGCECRMVTTLEEGLRQSIDFNAHMTLLDLHLPDAPVFSVVSAIEKFTPPVIVISDIVDPDSSIEMACYAHRAANFISKKALNQTIIGNAGDLLVDAITKAHWRRTLPAALEKERNGNGRSQSPAS